MICPRCLAPIGLAVRRFEPYEFERSTSTLTADTVKTKPNAAYRLPDSIGCEC